MCFCVDPHSQQHAEGDKARPGKDSGHSNTRGMVTILLTLLSRTREAGKCRSLPSPTAVGMTNIEFFEAMSEDILHHNYAPP